VTGLRHAATYRVRFDEAGPDGLLRTSGLLRYAQDVAWRHSEAAGFDRGWYASRGLGWVVRAAELEISAQVPMGAELEVTTEVVGFHRIWARRRAECRLDGSLAGWVQTDWVILDARGRLARVPPELVERFPADSLSGSLLRVPLREPAVVTVRHELTVRPHELDPMNHVNNAVFVDWLEEALAGLAPLAACPRRYRLEYAAAASPGARLILEAWQDGAAWSARLTGRDGTVVLRASITEEAS
jgi:acyl-ACP thioesterase